MQRQRHEHKIQQLQRTARALQAGEAGCPAPEAVRLQEQQQGLEKIRQQLLCAAGLLTSFVNQTVDRSVRRLRAPQSCAFAVERALQLWARGAYV